MQLDAWRAEDDRMTSLAVVLPLALAGFVVVAGCWTLFATAGVPLRDTLGLRGLQFGLLLAMPMAVGGLLAVPAGLAAQKFGARRVMLGCLAGLALCMLLLMVTNSFAGYLLAAAGLGLSAGFYTAGLQFVASHSPHRKVGLVLGVFGAGITGAGLNYYLVPLLQAAFSWQAVPLAYLIVLLLVMLLLILLTEDSDAAGDPNTETSARQLFRRLRSPQVWTLCSYFGVVAGSFFALALWLPDLMASQFYLTVAGGARLAQWFVIPGALFQIVGGGLADRYGCHRVITRSLMVCLVTLFILSYPTMTLSVQGISETFQLQFALPLFLERTLVIILGISLGSAIGALLRMMVDQNPDATAFVAGMLVLSACVVAFLLPVIFGAVNDWLGVRSAAFMILFVMLSACLVLFTWDRRRSERAALFHLGV